MSKVIIADADALIALSLENDPHHDTAVTISEKLMKRGFIIIFPVTVFPEAITTLKRSLNQPKKAHLLNKQLQSGAFQVEYITEKIMRDACLVFDQAKSKQNTLFDALVASVAKNLEAKAIFSFDDWYHKLGFSLAKDLVFN